MSVRVLVVALAAQLLLAAGLIYVATEGWPDFGGPSADSKRQTTDAGAAAVSAAVPRSTAHRFDAARAFRHLRAQVALGPRPAGSNASRRLALRLRSELPAGRFESVPGGLRNVVGHLPGRRPAVVIAAHYDTKDIPGFVGANDGAGGTAAVVELARGLRRIHRRAGAPELRFVLFDGEESPRGSPDANFLRDGLRGSRAYAARHAGGVRSLILLDFIAQRDVSLPREEGSDAPLWSALRAAARRVGVARVFPGRVSARILDDHTPFTQRGIPAIDLIDFDYPPFHTVADTVDKLSARSLDAVGEAVFDLALRL